MPFGLSRRRSPRRVVVSSPSHHYRPPEKYCGMILRLNIDCNACYKKLRRIVLNMKGIETHMIEKNQRRLFVCGKFVPSDVAIHIKKKMKRRVEILEVHELDSETSERDQTDDDRAAAENNNNPHLSSSVPMVVYPGQAPSSSFHYCKSAYSPAMEIVQVWDDDCDYCVCVVEEEEEEEAELLPYDKEITGLEGPSCRESNNYLDYY